MSFTVTKASDLADDTILYKDTVGGVEVITSKSISEMKTLLGLPSDMIHFYVSLTNAADTLFVESLTELHNESGITPTIDRSSTGKYSLSWASSFANFTNKEAIVKITPIYDSRYGHLPSDYEVNYVAGNDSVEIQFYESGVLADVPTNESIDLLLEVIKF